MIESEFKHLRCGVLMKVEVPLSKVGVWFEQNWKVGKVKVGHFFQNKGDKVRVGEITVKNDK